MNSGFRPTVTNAEVRIRTLGSGGVGFDESGCAEYRDIGDAL